MRFTELVRDDLIVVNLEATTKWEAIEELVDLLIGAHELRLSDRADVIKAVFERERSLSTGLERGLAVPHGTVDCLDDTVAALGTSATGIPFESLDGQPAQLVVLLLVPRGKLQRHVRTLASIAKLASSDDLRTKIVDAKSPDELIDILYMAEAAQEAEELADDG